MSDAIAVVGVACRYPDARTHVELWENVLAGRRAFRRMPAERLRLADYFSDDRGAADATYSTHAAVIEGEEFDRVRFRVAGPTFRSTDPAHWLALDVASRALADAGFPDGQGLPRETTGVLLGNTLTGEFSRAASLRLRWPYVRRVLASVLREESWPEERRELLLQRMERSYKQPFPPVTEETLAGSLSNTIAGRICNHFDLKGGGYTIDGACASSLLAVATGCSALMAGDLDVALAGGVDLSLDPFELIGFAKTGALAVDDMRVFDARSQGFWPGEGCGFAVLVRHDDAIRERRRVYAVVRGWGISSDGSGGLTRPELHGQLLSIRRAYKRAGFAPDTISYFEGHGTGTPVGDTIELRALTSARRESAPNAAPAAVGSIKGNIGHTKAAAGIAGLIKAALALDAQVVPPTTGCKEPHPELTGAAPALRIVRKGEMWPSDLPLRAGVSSMGFGGINTHVVLESAVDERRRELTEHEQRCLRSQQDAELFLLAANSVGELRARIDELSSFAPSLALAELGDLGAQLHRNVRDDRIRAALVASTPEELVRRLQKLSAALVSRAESEPLLDVQNGLFFGVARRAPRVGFLFPGQASPTYSTGGAWARRFETVDDVYRRWPSIDGPSNVSTAAAQPAIVKSSIAGLRVLDSVGVGASAAIGHSLGELTALCWAGALDEAALMQLVAARGRLMVDLSHRDGAMASVAAPATDVERWLAGTSAVVAAINAPRHTVISGRDGSVARAVSRARAAGVQAIELPVSHAFHSPLMDPVVPRFAEYFSRQEFRPVRRHVISTVTASTIGESEDLKSLLCRQLTSPVQFLDAIRSLPAVDFFIEVGPGRVLSGIVKDITDVPAIALDAGGESLTGLLHAVGAAFALGAPLNTAAFWSDRFTRPLELPWRPRFFVNPCERAPLDVARADPRRPIESDTPLSAEPAQPHLPGDLRELVRGLAARRAELPLDQIRDSHRLLSDLHLNSITVGELLAAATTRLKLPPLASTSDLADATIGEVAGLLAELAAPGQSPRRTEPKLPAGVDTWIRAFSVVRRERERSRRARLPEGGGWRVVAASDHPLGEPLQRAFAHTDGGGIVACVPVALTAQDAAMLIASAQAASRGPRSGRFVAVQQGGGASAVAKTLFLEAPWITTVVVDTPFTDPRAADWIVAEALAADGFVEVQYDASGRRSEPVLTLVELTDAPTDPLLNREDLLVVTGGGKGIAAECALALARETGVRLALLGRSDPASDDVLAANLQRIHAAGVKAHYVATDVTDAHAVREAARHITTLWGPPTAILHGAGTNTPRLLDAIDEDALAEALSPKINGARNLLAAIDPGRLKLFVAFGSLTARTGMRGDAHYALANEWLTRLTEELQLNHPGCRCLAIEWSVWSGLGMGERIGRLESLLREGITPITPDQGIAMLRRLIATRTTSSSVVVTGRFGAAPTLRLEPTDLPFLRFLEKPRVHYPGIELVVDADLSPATDPYVDDHVLSGERLLPAVLGLEAMAEAAMAITGASVPPLFESVAFRRPIAVLTDESTTIRIAALVRSPGLVEVALRTAATGFHVDHFAAVCRFAAPNAEAGLSDAQSMALPTATPLLALEPDRDLYGTLLFQRGRFQRLCGYRRLLATECLAEIRPSDTAQWFARYLPGHLVLGDPGSRDAAIHAVQACIPNARLVPVAVRRVEFLSNGNACARFVRAHETGREGPVFTYDLDLLAVDGRVVERWLGLQLQKVEELPRPSAWPTPLLAPYVERRIRDLNPEATVRVAVEMGPAKRRPRSSAGVLGQLLGFSPDVRWRPDGKIETSDARHVSVAHSDQITMAVADETTVGCDIEPVRARSVTAWHSLLNEDRCSLADLIARQAGEDWNTSATRVWTASECLSKAGAMMSAPLLLVAARGDGWVQLGSGSYTIETFVAPLRSSRRKLAIATLMETEHAHV